MKKMFLTAAVFIMTLAAGIVVQADTVNELKGRGTWNNPYKISNADELKWFADYCNTGGSTSGNYYSITTDIALTDKTITANTTAADAEAWTPIMNFAGTLMGGNHTISGLYVHGTEYAGLFGITKDTAAISHLTIDNSFFEGTKYTGAIVAYSNGKRLYSCYNRAEVCSTADGAYTGGLIGYQSVKSEIGDCENYGNVTGTDYTGGIAGYLPYMDDYAYVLGNFGTVRGTKYAGGIAGYIDCDRSDSTTLSHCFNIGDIYASDCAGGIAGYSDISTGSSSSGGSAAFTWFMMNTIKDCFNYGKITAEHTYPIAGHDEGCLMVEYCYYLEGTASPDVNIERVILPNGGGIKETRTELGSPLTADEFAVGKATYLLNTNNQYSYGGWGQNVDNDKPHDIYPMEDTINHANVFFNVLDNKYSNTQNPYEEAYAMYGEVTMDESLDLRDVIQVAKKAESSEYLMPIEEYFAQNPNYNTGEEKYRGDINKDGKITTDDVKLMLKIMMLS